MTYKNKHDAIILTTTFGERIENLINFLNELSISCMEIEKIFTVVPVIIFEKSEVKKYLKLKEYFASKKKQLIPYILLNKNGSGFSSCLNYGIKNTFSEWILRIDTDDHLTNERILNQLNIMKKNNLDMSSGFMQDEKGKILSYPKNKFGLITNLLIGTNPIAHPSVCIRRDALSIKYNSELNRCEDFELWINLFLKSGFKWKCIDYPLTIYNTERSKLKDQENAIKQIKIRLRYSIKLFIVGFALLVGIFGNIFRILLGKNIFLGLRRKLK